MTNVAILRIFESLNQIQMQNILTTTPEQNKELVQQLNELLANYQLYYQNLRGFHWNIVGPGFFELHAKFETMYNAAQLVIDEVAERIRTLEGTPLHSFTDYLAKAEIPEMKNHSTAIETVKGTLANLAVILKQERAVRELASQFGDEATVDLMNGDIQLLEKESWMLNAYAKGS